MPLFQPPNTIEVLNLSDWLDMAAGTHPDVSVNLPWIQRGFVWKPQQIIDLWDSLLSGMPIGALMVSQGQDGVALVPGQQTQAGQCLALVDGQQRTLAMLAGWRAFAPDAAQHRLWVDLADEPAPGHCLRLRVSTRSQPFGYQRQDGNTKLSMDQRRRAQEAYADIPAKDLLARATPHPAGAACSMAVDLGYWVQEWRRINDRQAWKEALCAALPSVKTLAIEEGRAVLQAPWERMAEPQRVQVLQRVDALADGLQRMMGAQIPLLRVDPALFSTDMTQDGAEPPLARLFRRVGSNATPLSDADYIFAVLKHMMPPVHDMVQTLHAHSRVAGFLTATDLVMSALRLAAVQWTDEQGKPVADHDNPGKDDFHRMVMRHAKAEVRQQDIKALLESEGSRTLRHCFDLVEANLAYQKEKGDDPGLPPLLLPYLGRSLVQVLLRLAQAGLLQSPVNPATRAQVLRLVLWWLRWVWDKPKASRIAFRVIRDLPEGASFDLHIAQAVVQEGAAMAMQTPQNIEALGLHESAGDAAVGAARFHTPEDDSEKHRRTREFYRHWWQHWNHRHPLLLWLQRAYVSNLDNHALAGMGEDTPYDFDHILASSHWSGDWRRVGKNPEVEDFRDARHVLGNSIGNIRVWHASRNRSDGDAPPSRKLELKDHSSKAPLLKDSAIQERHADHWLACSPGDGQAVTDWNRPRVLAFQKAVELRAFALYQQLYDTAGFAQWTSQWTPAEPTTGD